MGYLPPPVPDLVNDSVSRYASGTCESDKGRVVEGCWVVSMSVQSESEGLGKSSGSSRDREKI